MKFPLELQRLGYRPALDGLRGAAVILVLLRHLGSDSLPGGGAVGVGVFFTLSGFLITTLMVEEWHSTGTVDLRAFFRRRFLRLLPALAGVLVIVLVYAMATGRLDRLLAPILAAGAYVMNYARIAGLDHSFLAHSWTLAVEEHFYLLWPATLLLFARRFDRTKVVYATLALAAAAGLWRVLLWTQGAEALRLQYGTDTRLDSMLIGCAAAVLFAGRLPAIPRWAGWASVAALAGLSALSPQGDAMVTWGYTLLPLAGIVLILHLLGGSGALNATARWRPAVALGRISYGVYLWHYVLWGMLRPVIPNDMSEWVRRPLLIGVALLVAAASFRWVEQPFLARKRAPTRDKPLPTAAGLSGVPAGVDDEQVERTSADREMAGAQRGGPGDR